MKETNEGLSVPEEWLMTDFRMEIGIGDLFLRGWRENDVEALVKYANNRNIWINMTDAFPHPYAEKDAVEWLAKTTKMDPMTFFAISTPEEAIGGIGFSIKTDVYRQTADIGYWLAEPFWGRNIVTNALKVVSDYAFKSFTLNRISAAVFEWNPASMRVLEKAGYVREGRLRKSVIKDGKVIDSVLYARIDEP